MLRSCLTLLALFCALPLVGCGGGEEKPEAPKEQGEISIRKPKRAPSEAPKEAPTAKAPAEKKAEPKSEAPVVDDRTFLLADRLPNYEIVPRDEAVLHRTHPVAFPSGGANSKTFDIVSRGATPPTGQADASFKLPKGFVAVRGTSYSSDGRPLRIRCEADGAEMAFVPAGSVTLGTDGAENASPRIEVFVSAFYIDVTEVTLAQFETYREALKKSTGRTKPEAKNSSQAPDFPAVGMTWTEAGLYTKWAGKELPTEAEWEKAARTEAGYEHPWGDTRAVWERFRATDQIDAVKSFRTDVSPYGVFDLAGNAREWVADWYDPEAFAQLEGAPPRDWTGPRKAAKGDERVVKGNGPLWEVWYRTGIPLSKQDPTTGFRCVLRLPE